MGERNVYDVRYAAPPSHVPGGRDGQRGESNVVFRSPLLIAFNTFTATDKMFEEFGAATQTARQQVCGEIKILSHACTKFSRTFQFPVG